MDKLLLEIIVHIGLRSIWANEHHVEQCTWIDKTSPDENGFV